MARKIREYKSKIGLAIWKRFRKEVSYIFEKTLTHAILEVASVMNIDLRVIQRSEFAEFEQAFKELGFNPEKMFAKADVIVAAISNGKLVHWEFVCFKGEAFVMEIERSIRILSNSAYIYGGYTVPAYRGQGIATKVIERAFEYLREKGFQRAYALARRNNFPMLRVMQKLGAQKIGIVTFIKLFNWKFYMLKSEKKENLEKLAQMFPKD